MIPVLDHGFARLVDYLGDDLAVVRAARVSYDADWRTGGEVSADDKLIGYLMRNQHTSPFEAVVFTFEIKAPIFVLRQWHRHRTWSYNEMSARYTEVPDEFYVPNAHAIGVQSTSSKQARDLTGIADAAAALYAETMRESNAKAFETYHALLTNGVPRELARSILPQATYSRMFATVNLHNLFHFIRLRSHKHAQFEIRLYADALLQLVKSVVPVCTKHFEKTL